MQFTQFNNNLPDWVRNNIKFTCPACGSYVVDNADCGRGMTQRRCANKQCPGHMSMKMDAMAKTLGVKGFGPKTALDYIRINKCKSHVDILSEWLKDSKPIMRLSEVAELARLEGYSNTTGEKELNSFVSFESYFSETKMPNMVLWKNKDTLFEIEKYFTIPEPLSRSKILVMGHGSYTNYNNRKDFFKEVNGAFGSIVQVIEVGVRKTGVSYLVMEEGTSKSGKKYKCAVDAGVPIITPENLVNILDGYVYK